MIDMDPNRTHLVELDIDADDVDCIGDYVGNGIDAYEVVRQLDDGWKLIRIEAASRSAVEAMLNDLVFVGAVRYFDFCEGGAK